MKMKRVETKNFKEFRKLELELSETKRYCKCGHSLFFPQTSKTDKTICSHCGRYIFKNDLIEFKYRFEEKKSKMK